MSHHHQKDWQALQMSKYYDSNQEKMPVDWPHFKWQILGPVDNFVTKDQAKGQVCSFPYYF